MSQYELNGSTPVVSPTAFVAPTATLVGRIALAAHASVWFGAILRGDNELIEVGAYSNVQDAAVLHTDMGYPLRIGERVTIGHQAMLHGCTIEEGALIGIQAVVLNGAVIGRHSLVGAGALITEGKVFPERSLILGSPAKVIRPLRDEEVARLLHAAEDYAQRAAHYRAHLHAIVVS